MSDYDLTNQESLREARDTLDLLKSTAAAEEATGFDASGSVSLDDCVPEHSTSAPDSSASLSRDTDLSSSVADLSRLDLRDNLSTHTPQDVQDLDNLDEETKALIFADIFPPLSRFTILHTLKKYQYHWKPTLDDLLNQVYFSDNDVHGEQEYGVPKGVDAFSEDHIVRRGRKGKKRAKHLNADDSSRSSSLHSDTVDHQPTPNSWQTAAKDIDFIASRLRIPVTTVSPIYHRQNASTSRTIAALLSDFLQKQGHVQSEDPSMQLSAYELGQKFPNVAANYLTALVTLTYPSTSAAHELAVALTKKSAQEVGNDSLDLVPRYAPLSFSDEEDHEPSRRSQDLNRSIPSLNFAAATSTANTYGTARQAAMAQARAAYRKSKSDRLMGGAAAYYSQIGRDYAASSQQYSAAAADALVASQSTASGIDLHGVSLQDAVRIAKKSVHLWWDDLGENKVNGRVGATERSQGFRIVTGVGRHSQGGRGVLGPGVKKMLEQDGWRIEVASGVILVKGRGK